jgi:hypothetical protein
MYTLLFGMWFKYAAIRPLIGSLKWCHDAKRCWPHCTYVIHKVKARSQPTLRQLWESKIGKFLPTSRQPRNNLQYLQQCHTAATAPTAHNLYRVIRKSLCTWWLQYNPHTVDDLKMVIAECIRNADRAILNTVFENTVRRVNKRLEIGGEHFEHYL